MLTYASTRPPLARALARLLARVEGRPDAPPPGATDGLPDLVRAYFRAKAERGGAAFAQALALSEADLSAFEAALRDVERTSRRLGEPSPSAQDERNAVLADVRMMSWLETVSATLDASLLDEEVEALVSLDVGRKQIRAIELIVRALILESYGDQERLLAGLREALGERVVRGWEAKADKGDVLSGCSFGELASLFVNKDEFARYERLYADTPFLTLLKERRRTIQAFLDDVRRIRNTIAHNKRVTNAQLSLLDLYHEELASPVQTAFDQGATKVDPGVYLEVGREELDRYAARLREDVAAVRDDLAGLRASLEGSLGAIATDTAAIRTTTKGIDRKLLAIGAGVVALLVGGYFLFGKTDDTKAAAVAAQGASARTEAATKETADVAKAAKEAALRTEEAAKEAAARTAAATKESADRAREAAEAAARTEAATKAAAKEAAEAAARNEAATKAAAKEAAEAAARNEAAAKAAAASSEKVVETLESLRAGFDALVRQGGTIAEADRPAAHYHNARVYEQRGDVALAMASYRKYFAFPDLGFVDPHLRYQALLRLQQGPGGAREVYADLQRASKNDVVAFAAALLLEGDARSAALDAYAKAHPEFAPAVYEQSREVSLARLGVQALEDKRLEKERLERFLALSTSGPFLAHYLDQSVAAEQVEDAKQRLAAVAMLPKEAFEHPVRLTSMRSNQGWMVTFTFAEVVREVFWRAGASGEFKSLGVQPGLQGVNGLPIPKTTVDLGTTAERQTLSVEYVDVRGRRRGPYEVVFDPDAEALVQGKNILDMTKGSWLLFRDYDGKLLLYFTSVLSYRGVLSEIRYGLDVDVPDKRYPFSPPADPKNPYAFGDGDVVYLEVPRATKFAVVQLTYKDGTKSEVVTIRK